MTALQRCHAAWNGFFHTPVDPRPLALLRIGYAVLVLVNLLALLPHAPMLWSDQGVLPFEASRSLGQGWLPTIFLLLPTDPATLSVCMALFGLQCLLLLLGFHTRLQAIGVFVWLVSFQNLNPLLTNGQDALLRLFGFYVIFLPCGAALSLDARSAGNGRKPAAVSAWALRLIQVQVTLVLLAAGLWKLRGQDWLDGSALYYVSRLDGFWGNLPVPELLQRSLLASQIASALTLAIELVVPMAIWVPSLRRWATLTAIVFHATIAYAMNLFLFEWIMIWGFCAFLRAGDLALAWKWRSRDDQTPFVPDHLPVLRAAAGSGAVGAGAEAGGGGGGGP
jgi:hypothetical protein